MSHFVFPQKKPSMSLEQAFAQTVAHCQAGQWQQAELLYQAIVQAQPSPVQGQYWLSYIDALIQTGKPQPALPAPGVALTATAPQVLPTQEIPTSIKLARPPNPRYTARQPRWPWKMALGCGHVPGRREIHLLLARYQRALYDEAETMARDLTRAFPRHDLGWKVLVAALRMQGRMAEAQQAQQQRSICCHVGRRNNLRSACGASTGP
jgi:protein O-GlcNAc transferase